MFICGRRVKETTLLQTFQIKTNYIIKKMEVIMLDSRGLSAMQTQDLNFYRQIFESKERQWSMIFPMFCRHAVTALLDQVAETVVQENQLYALYEVVLALYRRD